MATIVLKLLRKRTDDYFFAGMSLLVLGTVFLGFARSYYLAGAFHARLPSAIVHIHGAVFSAWILLLVTQTALVSIGRVSWHKRLGILGAVLACLMVVLGVLAAIDSSRRRFTPPGLDSPTILAFEATELSAFAFLVAWGLRVRRDGAAHKRLMLLATIAILGPAVNRWPFAFIHQFPPSTGLVIDALLICVIVFDLLTRRKIHRATVWGSLSILVMQPTMFALGHSAFWHRFTERVQR
jgi:uncharacterized membrane protein YozB (DUF420 family)